MSEEKEPYCLLGHGTCPTDCRLNEYALELTAAVEANGDNFDPVASRRAIVFGDVFDHNVNVVQVIAVMAACAKEPKKSRKS